MTERRQNSRVIFSTIRILLNGKGIKRRKFRQIVHQASGWGVINSIAQHLCCAEALVLKNDGKAIPVYTLFEERGGEFPYLTINQHFALNGDWVKIFIPPTLPTPDALLEIALKLKHEDKPLKLSRRQRQLFGKKSLAETSMSASEFFKKLQQLMLVTPNT